MKKLKFRKNRIAKMLQMKGASQMDLVRFLQSKGLNPTRQLISAWCNQINQPTPRYQEFILEYFNNSDWDDLFFYDYINE